MVRRDLGDFLDLAPEHGHPVGGGWRARGWTHDLVGRDGAPEEPAHGIVNLLVYRYLVLIGDADREIKALEFGKRFYPFVGASVGDAPVANEGVEGLGGVWREYLVRVALGIICVA